MAKLKDDQIRWILSLDAEGVQAELQGISSVSKKLEADNKSLASEMKAAEKQMNSTATAMERLRLKGKENSTQYKELENTFQSAKQEVSDYNKRIADNTKSIADNNAKAKELITTAKLEDLTFNQLKQRARELETQLNSTSKAANPESYRKLQTELAATNARMGDLRNSNKDSESSFQKLSTGITKYWGIAAAGVASLVGVFAGLKDIMMSNQTTGDKLQFEIDGLSSSFQVLKVAVANMDFSNLINDMSEAYKKGKEASQMLDELFERTNSFKITSKVEIFAIEELKTKLRDVNLTAKERLAISNEIEKRTMALANEQKKISKQEYDAKVKQLEAVTGLSKAERAAVIDKYENNRKIIQSTQEVMQMEEDLQALRKMEYIDGGDGKRIYNKAIGEQANALEKNIDRLKKTKDYSEFISGALKKYGKASDEVIQGYVTASENYTNIQIQATEDLRRTRTANSKAQKDINDAEIENKKKALEKQKKLKEDQIKKEMEAVDEWATAERIKEKNINDNTAFGRERLARRLEEIELEGLRRRLEINGLEPKKILEIQEKILDAKQKMVQKAIDIEAAHVETSSLNMQDITKQGGESMKQTTDQINQQQEESFKIEQEQMKQREQMQAQYGQMAQGFAGELGAMLGESLTNQEQSAAEFQYNMLMLTLDTLRQIVMMAATQAIAKEVGTKGILGIATGAAAALAINLAFGAIKGMIKKPSKDGGENSSRNSSAPTTSTRVVTTQRGYADGGYTGAGGKYEIAGFLPNGAPYHRGEYFVPQEEMRHPQVFPLVRQIESIRRQRTSTNPLPGFADGGFNSAANAAASGVSAAADRQLMSNVYSLLHHLAVNGVTADYSLSDNQKQQNRLNRSLSLRTLKG